MLQRRDALRWGVGAALLLPWYKRAAAQPMISPDKRRLPAVPHQFPPFELQASRNALLALESGIAGYVVERVGNRASLLWIKDRAGQVWTIGADQRDLQFMFEVFTLGIEPIEAMQARIAAWKPPQIPAGVPENIRQLLSTRPEPPRPSTAFQAWPLASSRVEVLRRAEYIIGNVDPGPTFGGNPIMQAPERPGRVPPEASASCDVAVGLLFTDGAKKRLLVGVDWMPFHITVTEDAPSIDEYIAPCARIAVKDYVSRLPSAA